MGARLRFSLILPLLCLVGCGGSEERAPETPTLHVAVSLLPQEQAAYQAIADEVAAELGFDIQVTALQYEDIRRTLQTEVRGGRGTLDVVEVDVFDLAATAGDVQGIDVHTEGINGSAQMAGIIDNQCQFVPHRLQWQALIYDSEAIPNPPTTWDELLAVAEQHSGAIGLKADIYEGLTCDLLPFIWQAGGDPLDPTNPGCIEAMRFLQRLAPHLNPSAPTYREGSVLQAQELGEIVLHQNWPFAVPHLRERGLMPGRMRTAPLPAGPAGSATVLGGGYLGISEVAPHPQEAAAFIEAMASARRQRQLVTELGWFPVREEAWDALSAQDREDYAGFIVMTDDVRPRPIREDYAEISVLWQEAFQRAALQGEDAEAVLSDIAGHMPAP